MGHFSLLLQEEEEEKDKEITYDNLSDEEKQEIDGFVTFESQIFKDLAGAVVEINKLIAAITKDSKDSYSYDDNKNYKNYVSREDYKIFFGMTDEQIDIWIHYATKIMRKPELVKNMSDKSYIKMKK